ncbi:hypothetical protein PHYSODRAFT_318805 [Phytophthora sojae]|uniref:M96 mating-specific protein family n=1 Tax=Phytophthora sojae (strain P6497) TaxID=1094619 RepID=G5A6S0_PHYSP|nr:hypothetical protein PHYSODRAFT_318805 [Phytophthora sojae]EGZ09025.1 hypothetical protein PHYSODRAFT_318805 [Phytophthora sojae]|eukprot:XP_009535658.1 hypothetical protein PHYSODRAFT_318805 [Phytophthora sojae]
MDDLVLDELMDFLHAPDELTLPTAFTLGDGLDDDLLLPDTDSLLGFLDLEDAERRSIYRQKQKAEKEALRREIDELSAKLDKLQDSPRDGSLSPSTDLALSSCLWKAIASRQKEHREAAEEEQLHLRAAISSRATLINDLTGFLKKRVHDGVIANGDSTDAPRHKRIRLEPTDSALFETFVQELHTVYLQTDEVAAACDFETSDAPSITKKKDGNTEYYQHADRQTLPFKQVCHSVWYLAQLKHRQEDRVIYEGLDDPENTIALKFRITSRRMGEKVSLLQRVVVRRFQKVNRVVVVWKVFAEGEGLFRGMHSDENGCNETTGTILDTCFRHVPTHFSSSASCTPVVNEFTDMIVSTGEEENQTVMKALEKMLLDDTLANVAS